MLLCGTGKPQPTLILIKPLPKVTVLGNLSDDRQVLDALRLTRDER